MNKYISVPIDQSKDQVGLGEIFVHLFITMIKNEQLPPLLIIS